MGDNRKANGPGVDTLRRYWWVLGIVAVVVVLGILKKGRVEEEAALEVAVAQMPPPAEVTASNDPPQEVNRPIAASEEELPIPEDAEAVARFHSSDGRPDIRDAAVVWQKRQDRYISFLDGETFEQGLYRTYIWSELPLVLGSRPNGAPNNHKIITYLARTRRFSKLIALVLRAKEQGDVEYAIKTIDATVRRFMKERGQVEQWFYQTIKEQPDSFRDDAPEDQRSRVCAPAYGLGSTGLETADDIIPMSLHGTQYGTVANCFLLGLTEHPRAVKPLLDVVAYDSEPLIEKLVEVWGGHSRSRQRMVRSDFLFANHVVVADAFDRILTACARDDTLGPEALAVARQYEQWRQSAQLPSRKVVQAYAYDEPSNPHHLPGRVLGIRKDTSSRPLELPLNLVGHRQHIVLDEIKEVNQIIDWAKRFDQALAG
jgi:hypothetical protein